MFTVANTSCRLLEVKKGNERESHRTDGITDFEIKKKRRRILFFKQVKKIRVLLVARKDLST